ncbi:MAG: hypothetical protein J2P15_10090 [Micromonosporaceae bacterium]|nr:hypothetical protein [Micromonosporaceae bacterium]
MIIRARLRRRSSLSLIHAVFIPIHRAVARRSALDALPTETDAGTLADRIQLLRDQIATVLDDLEPEIGPRRTKARAQIDKALNRLTAAHDRAINIPDG